VVRADGTRSELPSVAERPKLAPTTTLETVTLDDHLQYAALTRPHGADPAVRYPVLVRVDGEPDRNAVLDAGDTYANSISGTPTPGSSWSAANGRGHAGPRFGPGQRRIAVDAPHDPDERSDRRGQSARRPPIRSSTPGRVGVIGTGFGGNLAALAAMLHPDVFAAAVAVSPIADWAELDAALRRALHEDAGREPRGATAGSPWRPTRSS